MILISEWLPNPEGSDAEGEWVELVNTSNASVDLSGWALGTGGARRAELSGLISPHGHRVFSRESTKLPLRNTDGALTLFEATGKVVDEVSFTGTAPEGKSISRLEGNLFLFTSLTPGEPNVTIGSTEFASPTHPPGTVLTHPLSALEVGGTIVGSALIITVLVLYALRFHAYTQKLFFSTDGEVRLGDFGAHSESSRRETRARRSA